MKAFGNSFETKFVSYYDLDKDAVSVFRKQPKELQLLLAMQQDFMKCDHPSSLLTHLINRGPKGPNGIAKGEFCLPCSAGELNQLLDHAPHLAPLVREDVECFLEEAEQQDKAMI